MNARLHELAYYPPLHTVPCHFCLKKKLDTGLLMSAEGKAGSLVDDAGHFYKPLQVCDVCAENTSWTLPSIVSCALRLLSLQQSAKHPGMVARVAGLGLAAVTLAA